jgi:hypothetical protein
VEDRYTQIAAAVYGAIAGALLSREVGWHRIAVIAITGSGFAVFVVPYLCQRFGIVSPQGIAAAGFLGGFLGYTILVSILKKAQDHNWISILINRPRKKDE